MAAELVSGALQFSAQLLKIVNLSIEHEDVAAIRRAHRLMTFAAQVQNRQAPVRHRDAGLHIGPNAAVVRSAMPQRSGHATGGSLQVRFSAAS